MLPPDKSRDFMIGQSFIAFAIEHITWFAFFTPS